MNTYVFHIDGQSAYDTLRVVAIDEQHAVNILLSSWFDSKPVTSEGCFRLTHVEKGNK